MQSHPAGSSNESSSLFIAQPYDFDFDDIGMGGGNTSNSWSMNNGKDGPNELRFFPHPDSVEARARHEAQAALERERLAAERERERTVSDASGTSRSSQGGFLSRMFGMG